MLTRFRFAPMSTAILILTVICLVIPIVFVVQVWFVPPVVRTVMSGVAVSLVVMYVGIWLWMRPTEFVVGPDELELRWPMRRRTIPRKDIVRVRKLAMRDLKREVGYILRVGAGGLGGGFGRARTAVGTMELWVSRIDWIVWIECRDRMSLLVTPDEPDRFVELLSASAK